MKLDQVGPPERESNATDGFTQLLSERLLNSAHGGLPKHLQLGQAILGLVRDGLSKPGDQILPEHPIADNEGEDRLTEGTYRVSRFSGARCSYEFDQNGG